MHSSTAEDMAKIMRYAIDNEDFLKITQTADYSFTDCDRKRSFEVHNKNVLLTMMDGVLSGKNRVYGRCGLLLCLRCKKKMTVHLSQHFLAADGRRIKVTSGRMYRHCWTMATRIIVIRLLISAKEFRIGRYML